MVNIIIEGCCHGELDQIYTSAQQIATEKGVDIDLLIICGDFQSVRNEQDLMCLACPAKYRQMNTFYKYYTGMALFIEKVQSLSMCSGIRPFDVLCSKRIIRIDVFNSGGKSTRLLSFVFISKLIFKRHCP